MARPAVLLTVLVVTACLALAQSAAPEWACSPPNTLNPACPAHLAGDPRCSETYCPPFAGCASSTCNARLGNLVADSVVALDAYAVKGEQCALSTVSLPECCSLCRSTRGCNAWSFCNAEGGCGKGCNSAKHGFAAGLLANPWDVEPTDLPDRLNPAHACTATGAWPFGTCTLKFLEPASLAAAPMAPGNQTGWVSGIPELDARLPNGGSAGLSSDGATGPLDAVVLNAATTPDVAAGTGAVPLTPESGASSAAYGDGMPGSYGGDLYLDPESSVPLVDTLTTLESAPASAPAPAPAPAVPTPPVRSAAGAARRGAAAALAGAAALLALLVL